LKPFMTDPAFLIALGLHDKVECAFECDEGKTCCLICDKRNECAPDDGLSCSFIRGDVLGDVATRLCKPYMLAKELGYIWGNIDR